MIAAYLEVAFERANALAEEGVLSAFLEREGLNPQRYVEVQEEESQAKLDGSKPERRADVLTVEFLRGFVVGVLAAREEAAAHD